MKFTNNIGREALGKNKRLLGLLPRFQKAVKQKYGEMSMEMPYPQMDLHLEE